MIFLSVLKARYMRSLVAIVAVLAVALAGVGYYQYATRFNMPATLAALADRQDLWANQFERNTEKAAALLVAAAAERSPGRRLELRQEAARQYVLAGQPGPAIGLLQELIHEAGTQAPPALYEALQFDLALAYLRTGEAQNCIWNHNVESCLIPIQGKGVHAHRLGSSEAIKVLSALLENPASSANSLPMYRWLLNIAYMTLGEYPGGVPKQWLIPPKAFESDYDIGRFRDVALRKGLQITGRAGGAIMDDFDNDGHLDLMVSSWGNRDPIRYFHNRGDATFTEQTEQAGLTGLVGGLDIFQADYDNDGYLDVFVPRGAWTHKAGQFPASLLHNEGDGTFADVTSEAGVLAFLPSQAAAWCDLDNDGWLDLIKGNELHQDTDWPPGTKNIELYRNRHDGKFAEVGAESGIRFRGMIKAVVCGDYDNDGWQDLYFSVIYGPNHLYRNLAAAGGGLRFVDVTATAGVAEPIMSFTTWFFDYNNDGWEDLFVTGYFTDISNIALEYLGQKDKAQGHRPRLYRNNKDGTFTDVAKALHVDDLVLTMGANYGDLDNDGWLDFYLGTGAPPVQILDPSRMYRNDRGEGFQDVTTSGGFGHLQKGHGVAFGDADNDGDQDIFSQIGGAFTGDRFWSVFFENPGHGNDWITLRLRGVKANRSAVGARIRTRVTTAAGTRDIYNTVSSGGSFGANSLQQEIGLGRGAAIESIQIKWPGSGTVQEFKGPIAVNRIYEIVEGQPGLGPAVRPE